MATDFRAPLQVGGRIYDVLRLDVEGGNARPRRGLEVFRCRCTVEVQERSEQTYRAFYFYVHDSAFARGEFDPENPETLLRRARGQVWEYLESNRQPLARSRWCEPVVMEWR